MGWIYQNDTEWVVDLLKKLPLITSTIHHADLSSVDYPPYNRNSSDSEVRYKVFTPWENIIQELNIE